MKPAMPTVETPLLAPVSSTGIIRSSPAVQAFCTSCHGSWPQALPPLVVIWLTPEDRPDPSGRIKPLKSAELIFHVGQLLAPVSVVHELSRKMIVIPTWNWSLQPLE